MEGPGTSEESPSPRLPSTICDLEELVKLWAWDTFLRTRGEKQGNLRYEDVSLEVNCSRLKMTPSTPEYSEERIVDLLQSRVGFTSTYENPTNASQAHSFQTEYGTETRCTTAVSKGFSMGGSLGFALALPEELTRTTADFGGEVTVDSTDESTHEEVMSWTCINRRIIIPPHSRTLAELMVDEKEFSAKFKVKVRLTGQMLVVVVTTLRDDNPFMQTVEGEISEILRTMADRLEAQSVIVEGGVAIWAVEGTCRFRFGVKHQVRLTQTSLRGTDGGDAGM